MKTAVRVFKALADTNRIRILKMLQHKPLCVCEITSILGLATSTVSKHLSILKAAGLITDRKDSKWVNYEIERKPENPEVRHALELVQDILEKDDTIKGDRRKTRIVDRNQICGTEAGSCRVKNNKRS
jgi:ArsR family transcriptional regulator, arsenate/arsenite/antimonite-responsive transcriptional repressor